MFSIILFNINPIYYGSACIMDVVVFHRKIGKIAIFGGVWESV
jgi:hypothetical protein